MNANWVAELHKSWVVHETEDNHFLILNPTSRNCLFPVGETDGSFQIFLMDTHTRPITSALA